MTLGGSKQLLSPWLSQEKVSWEAGVVLLQPQRMSTEPWVCSCPGTLLALNWFLFTPAKFRDCEGTFPASAITSLTAKADSIT